MADDKKIIFSMVGVSKAFQANKQVLKDIYLSFFYGAKIGIIGLNGCLLYTSPSPRDPKTSRMPSSA